MKAIPLLNTKKRGTLILIFLFGFCLSAQSLMIRLPLRTLAREAEVILLGEVREVRSDWSMDRRLILTTASIRIQEIWKGRLNHQDVLIQIKGGQVGEIELRVSDVPRFRTGENVVLFLKAIPDPAHPRNTVRAALAAVPVFSVFGKAQGKYSVGRDEMVRKYGYTLLRGETDPEASLSLRSLRSQVKDMVLSRARGKGPVKR